MRGKRSWIGAGLVMLLAGGCSPDRDNRLTESDSRTARANPELAAQARRAELQRLQATIAAEADSVQEAFRGVRALTREERRELRRDVNAGQIATARSLGVRASGEAEITRLRGQGRLVALEDSTRYWVLRDLEHSVPFVTPDAKAMLQEVGRRFHARLDSLGLPRYRMQVTSVLRTAETQADLRQSNANASQGVSAHEFGTTLDVSHVRFTAPAASRVASNPELAAQARQMEAGMLEEAAKEHAAALQAELGRVLREMRAEGKLRVMMESRQPVYHMTVARSLR
jgi:hypothetical protein